MPSESRTSAKPFQAIAAEPWAGEVPPRRILAIRLQAMGDVTITLPYVRTLQEALPDAEIDYLTREEARDIPASVVLFRRIYALGGGRNAKRQMALALALAPALRRRRYDAVIDLQNSLITKVLRRLIQPPSWSAYDPYAPISAGEGYRRTIEAAGFPMPRVVAGLCVRDAFSGVRLLREAGWDGVSDLVVLNPAGGFPSRNWPLASYAAFASLWSQRRAAQFAIVGTSALRRKADVLKQALGDGLIDLTGATTPGQALAIVQKARLVLSEDSGLMHMAWVAGAPTLALFGSSPHVWCTPIGTHTRCLHSGDMPCGSCLNAECRFGDVRCLTRYTPELVVEEAEALLRRTENAIPCVFEMGP